MKAVVVSLVLWVVASAIVAPIAAGIAPRVVSDWFLTRSTVDLGTENLNDAINEVIESYEKEADEVVAPETVERPGSPSPDEVPPPRTVPSFDTFKENVEKALGHQAQASDDTVPGTPPLEVEREVEVEIEESSDETMRNVNFASQAAGALVLRRNPEMKGSKKLLIEDRDQYALSPCNAKKFVVIQLSDDVRITRVSTCGCLT